jgi:4-hydroxybenzoate polyprenyltransferase
VWSQARHAIVVDAADQVVKAARKQGNVSLVLPRRAGTLFRAFVSAIRVHQWVKNLLIFVPILTSHRFLHADLLLQAVIAFFAMSLCASSVYVVNDLADIDADREHPSKRQRPLASGRLPIPAALLAAPALFGLGVALSLFLAPTATAILCLYTLVSTLYTFLLKKKLLADVITLSLLYTLRIIEGGAATSLLVSPWLFAFSLFTFMSLAFTKRVTEMIRLSATGQHGAAGRGYSVSDTLTLASLGAASGYLACVVMSLYINTDAVRQLYMHPGWLWLLMPLLLYWFGRFWIITMRGEMPDDPVTFLFRDRHTYATIFLCGLVFLLAKSAPFGIPGVME